jgi:MFS family permease
MPKEVEIKDQTNILPHRQLVVVFLALASSLFIAMIDQNAIGIMLPTIGRDLNALQTISWAGTSSLIGNTCFQVLYGRMSDIFGRKVVFLSAMGLLGTADICCSFAQTSTQLYVFRGIAGIAGGGITGLTMMIVGFRVQRLTGLD